MNCPFEHGTTLLTTQPLTYFSERHLETATYEQIFPEEHRLDPPHSMLVALTKLHTASVSSPKTSKEQIESYPNMSAPVTVSNEVLVAPFTRHGVQASTSIQGLLKITPIWAEEKASKTKVIANNGVIDALPQRLFQILISNLSNLPTRLQNKENIAVASKPTKYIIHPIVVYICKNTDASSDVKNLYTQVPGVPRITNVPTWRSNIDNDTAKRD